MLRCEGALCGLSVPEIPKVGVRVQGPRVVDGAGEDYDFPLGTGALAAGIGHGRGIGHIDLYAGCGHGPVVVGDLQGGCECPVFLVHMSRSQGRCGQAVSEEPLHRVAVVGTRVIEGAGENDRRALH